MCDDNVVDRSMTNAEAGKTEFYYHFAAIWERRWSVGG
jgi:hypothetical protein